MLALLAFVPLLPAPIELHGLTLERATSLHGKPVLVSFLVAKPLDVVLGKTVVGAGDRPDEIERTAVLKGKRFDVKEGSRATVAGTLWVIRHRPDFVNGSFVPAWVEIRVEQE